LIKDRYTWLRHTYYQLMRQIINWKRLQGDDDLAAAAGVLCYARSLTKIAEAECQRQIKTKTLDEEEAKKAILIPTYSDENLEKSIRAKSESNRFKIQLGMSKTSWRTAIAALIIAILVANISIVNMAKGGTGYITASLYHEFASWLASHPIHVNIVVFIFVYYVIAGSRTPSQQVRVEKGVMRLVMALPNIHAARITVFLIGAGLLAGAVYAAHMLRDWTTVIRSIIG